MSVFLYDIILLVISMTKIKDSVLGFAIGDAMGVPIEFKKREELINNPITMMVGGGVHNMPKGVWSDDTSLTIATMDSIIKSGRLDYKDMADRFCLFMNKGEYTSTGVCFDIGNTTKIALNKYLEGMINPILCGGKGLNDSGNGSLMRMLPIALYAFYNNLRDDEVLNIVKKSSSITHANDVCILGCFIYVLYLLFLLNGKDKFASYNMIKCYDYSLFFDDDITEYYNRLLKANISKVRVDDIKSDGYVVHSLEAVLWIILNCNSFAESIVGAINLGDDTDTIGAIVGSIAGIIYGLDGIPSGWVLENQGYLDQIINLFEEELRVYE